DDKVEPAVAHPEYGRFVQLKAQVQWASGDASRSLAGKSVYWYFKNHRSNDPTNKRPLKGKEKAGFDSAGGSLKKVTQADAHGWTPPVKFYLSRYGGDTFSISATDNSGYTGGLTTGVLTVWRKFWYQVTEMSDGSGGVYTLPAGVTSQFEAGYQSVF